MRHWVVYHSQRTMEHSYASLGEHAVYSRKELSKLCFGDVIWVVEGSTDTPTTYSLVDCFRYTETDYRPFQPPYSDFQVKVRGNASLLSSPVQLDTNDGWAADLRGRFLTKQRFFVDLFQEPEIVRGLVSTTGIDV